MKRLCVCLCVCGTFTKTKRQNTITTPVLSGNGKVCLPPSILNGKVRLLPPAQCSDYQQAQERVEYEYSANVASFGSYLQCQPNQNQGPTSFNK